MEISSIFEASAEEPGYEGQDIAQNVKKQQTLDREERAAWRDVQADMQVAEIQAEEKMRADEIRMAQTEATKDQAKTKADEEVALSRRWN